VLVAWQLELRTPQADRVRLWCFSSILRRSADAATVPAILPAVADVLAPIDTILAAVAHVFATVDPVLDPVAETAVDAPVEYVLAPVDDVFAPIPSVLPTVAHVLAPVAHVFDAIAETGAQRAWRLGSGGTTRQTERPGREREQQQISHVILQ
jgi:hypothetical protein